MAGTFFDTLSADELVTTAFHLSKCVGNTARWRSGLTDSLQLVYAPNGPFVRALHEISSRIVVTFNNVGFSKYEEDGIWLMFPTHKETCMDLVRNYGHFFQNLSIREFPPRNMEGASRFLDLVAYHCTSVTQLRMTSSGEASEQALLVLIPSFGQNLTSLYIRNKGSFSQLSTEALEVIARNCRALKRFSITGNYGLNNAPRIWKSIGTTVEELELDFRAKSHPNQEFEIIFLAHASEIHNHCTQVSNLTIRKEGDKAGYSTIVCAFGERLKTLSINAPSELACRQIVEACTNVKVTVYGLKGESSILNIISPKLSGISITIPEITNSSVLRTYLDRCNSLENIEMNVSLPNSNELANVLRAKKFMVSKLIIKFYRGSINGNVFQSIADTCAHLQHFEISTRRIDDVEQLRAIASTNINLCYVRLVELGQRSKEEAAYFIRSAIAALDQLPHLKKVYIRVNLRQNDAFRRRGRTLEQTRPVSLVSRPNHRADITVRCTGGSQKEMRANFPWWT